MSIKLTDTQLVILRAAAQHEDRCLVAPESLKGGKKNFEATAASTRRSSAARVDVSAQDSADGLVTGIRNNIPQVTSSA